MPQCVDKNTKLAVLLLLKYYRSTGIYASDRFTGPYRLGARSAPTQCTGRDASHFTTIGFQL
jgi:hypothetical protein